MDYTSITEMAKVGVLLSSFVTETVLRRRILKKYKMKSSWQEKWLKNREEGCGVLHMLRNELLNQDSERYFNFLRMDNENFNKILSVIRRDISKQVTPLRQAIPAEHR